LIFNSFAYLLQKFWFSLLDENYFYSRTNITLKLLVFQLGKSSSYRSDLSTYFLRLEITVDNF